ncbi:UDP-glycosyltransferase 86A1 isoform X2 [Oryza brachyantha]|uniref:UDP-glycosyltransferase 86A1 isoform X2 n=1 Tax=Oryza brachyantha TaxID=4533 RepID=UPI001ADA2925|nr:UDP-glycosyltransferase 86A1 isoform X2 [Oryza brachyantha]
MGQEAVAANGGGGGRPHAVVVPYPLQGHVIPAVHLALRLAARGFAVTFVNTESVHQQIASGGGGGDDIFAGAAAGVRYELVGDGFPLGFDRSLNHDQYMEGVLHVLPAHVDELLRRLIGDADAAAATCLVVDTFFVWPATFARKFGVPYVSFWTEPALIFTLYYHMDLLTKNGHFNCKDDVPVLHQQDLLDVRWQWIGMMMDQPVGMGSPARQEPRKDTITYVPGVAAIEPRELMSYLQETDTTTVVHRIIFKAFEEARAADYVVCNTVEELEPSTIAALRAEKPFYAVGPILPAGFARSAVATSMWAESDCSQWLAAQPPASVLYISFGSYAHVTRGELHEIARGVLASGARFLWVMRPDIVSSDDPDPLPNGFAAAAAGRGVVVPWCCQVEVLSHPAVGAFLTHCGWNSILESVWAGVPMLCFPLLTDQFTNRRLVSREWRVGVPVGDRGAVVADEVRARIEGVMRGEEGERLREQVSKMRSTLKAAVAPGGSSQRSFDELVDELMCRCGGRR